MANTSKCPLHRLTKLAPKKWESSKLIEIEQTAKMCTAHPHKPLKEVTLNARNEFGRFWTTTPLMIATEQGDLEMVKRIVEVWEVDVLAAFDKKYAVNAKPWSQSTTFEKVSPLFVAALHHHYEIVRYLVENGADVSARTSKNCGSSFGGLTPLHAAFILGHPNSTSEQLERIIRFLVYSGADPSALSSSGIPVWMIGGFINYKSTCEDRVQGHLFYHPEAIHLLIELGMSVKQKFLLGRSVFHRMASEHHIDNVDVIVQLLLENGADLQARDNDGISPIMAAAIGDNKVPNISFLEYLLERGDIPNKDKIDALEVATAVLLGSSYWNTLRETFSLYLAQAQNLRIQENCILVPETPRERRSAEWITSSSGDVDIAEQERQLQSILIRLRIFSGMSWGALLRHLWPYINDQYIMEQLVDTSWYDFPGGYRSCHDQLFDICWTMLETIRRFMKGEEEGIWLATVQVVTKLSRTLFDLFHGPHTLPTSFTSILETSLDLALTTFRCKNESEEKLKKNEFSGSMCSFHRLFNLAVKVPDLLVKVLRNKNTSNTVRLIVSRNVCYDEGALILKVCNDLPSGYLFDVVDLFLQYGADPHTTEVGYGVLHYLAIRERNKEQGIGATARLFLEKGVCLDRVSQNCFHETAAELYRRRGYQDAYGLPDWLEEGVPKLLCQSAKVIRRNKIPYKSSPVCLHGFVERH